MRAIIVMPLAEQRGGAELMLKHLALHSVGVEWHFIFLEEGPMVKECQSLGITTYVVKAGRLRHLHRYLQTVYTIAAIARRVEAESIIGWMSKGHVYGGVAAILSNLPAFWFQLGLPADVHWLDRLATLIPAKTVLTCSRSGADAQSKLWPHRKTTVVHPGTDISMFSSQALPSQMTIRDSLELPADAPVITLVGRLQRWKGVHVFVDAMSRVIEHYPDALGIVVGGKHDLEPDYPDFLRQKINSLGLRSHVDLVGFQSNVPEWMNASDVVVHASDREPFGIVVIEAMALGKPVVAGAEGGPREIVSDGIDGLLVPYGDADTLAQSIQRYLDDSSFAARVGTAAQERAKDFSSENFALRFRDAVQPHMEASAPSETTSTFSLT